MHLLWLVRMHTANKNMHGAVFHRWYHFMSFSLGILGPPIRSQVRRAVQWIPEPYAPAQIRPGW